MNTAETRRSTRPLRLPGERVLLGCGAVGPALFVLTSVVLGATREHYDPWRHPVSSLSIGTHGWMQAANFVVTGTLVIAFAEGLRRRLRREGGPWTPVLIAVVGVGLIGAGLFTADPISGFPPGTPATAAVPSPSGRLHYLFSALVFFGIPVAAFVTARRCVRRGRFAWAGYSIASGVTFLIGFVLAGAAFAQNDALVAIGGLLQRLTLVVGLGWIAMTALVLLRRHGDR